MNVSFRSTLETFLAFTPCKKVWSSSTRSESILSCLQVYRPCFNATEQQLRICLSVGFKKTQVALHIHNDLPPPFKIIIRRRQDIVSRVHKELLKVPVGWNVLMNSNSGLLLGQHQSSTNLPRWHNYSSESGTLPHHLSQFSLRYCGGPFLQRIYSLEHSIADQQKLRSASKACVGFHTLDFIGMPNSFKGGLFLSLSHVII